MSNSKTYTITHQVYTLTGNAWSDQVVSSAREAIWQDAMARLDALGCVTENRLTPPIADAPQKGVQP